MRRIPLGLGALQEREFRLFFTGQMVSLLGDAVTPFALAWAVLDLTGSARDLGFVLAAKIAPLVVFLLVGGVFADRLPRRGVMLTADVARMAVQAATAALLLSHTARIWELIVLQAFAGIGTAFFNPASTGLTPMTVSAGRLQEANALLGVHGTEETYGQLIPNWAHRPTPLRPGMSSYLDQRHGGHLCHSRGRGGAGAAALRCCVVRETRLDTARIRAARRAIDPIFLDTPLYRCEALEPDLGCTVSIKLETANPVRSFKARGTEVIASLLADHGSRAVVCASAGNLGQALAWSGRGRGLDVTVVASRFAPAAKLDRIRALDARLKLVDGDFDMAREKTVTALRAGTWSPSSAAATSI